MEPLITAAELVPILRISRRKFDALYLEGKLPPCVRIGNKRFWRREDITDWLQSLVEPRAMPASSVLEEQ